MTGPDHGEPGGVPPRALVISLGALGLPAGAALIVPDLLGEQSALLWLLALIPAFLLAYYKGWRGAAVALSAGMATLSLTHAAALLMGLTLPEGLFGVVVAYIVITLAVGWMAEVFLRDKRVVEGMAFEDGLTHLPNRRHARVFLDNEFAAAQRGRLLCVVLFDLDNFKSYNDEYGHAAGDEALKAFAEILSRTTRRMNLSARFGGEEFLSILAGSDLEGSLAFAERVRTQLKALNLGGGPLTVSAGVAQHRSGMTTPDEILAAADHALYRAKREGRDTVRLFGTTLLDAGSKPVRRGRDSPTQSTAGEYPRPPDEMGKSRPPLVLLPHEITLFGAGRKILLVEDEDPVKELISSYLGREGFAVTEARDVAAALRALSTDFDVVVASHLLAAGTSEQLVRAVKSRWPATQVVVTTMSTDVHAAAEGLASGADRHLAKPFGMPELRVCLIDCMAQRDRAVSARGAGEGASHGGERDDVRTHVEAAVLALVRGTEAKDPGTVGHGETVGAISVAMARALPPEAALLDLHAVRLGGLIHDVGMISLPTDLLRKGGPLTPEEWAAVRTHPGVGRRLMVPLIHNETVTAAVTWHHERWDGRGYPDGLSGNAIPLVARITAIADALSAMTSPRAFRQARSLETAVEEIRESFGSRYDPGLAEAFDTALPRIRELSRFSEIGTGDR